MGVGWRKKDFLIFSPIVDSTKGLSNTVKREKATYKIDDCHGSLKVFKIRCKCPKFKLWWTFEFKTLIPVTIKNGLSNLPKYMEIAELAKPFELDIERYMIWDVYNVIGKTTLH